MRKPIEFYKGFGIFYYETPPEQYIGCKGINLSKPTLVVRGKTLEEIKKQIDILYVG